MDTEDKNIQQLSEKLALFLFYLKTAANYERNGLNAISGKPLQEKIFNEAVIELPPKHLQRALDSIEPAIHTAQKVSHELAKDAECVLKKVNDKEYQFTIEEVETPEKEDVYSVKHRIDGSVEHIIKEVEVDTIESEFRKLFVEGIVSHYIKRHRKELDALAVIIYQLNELSYLKTIPQQTSGKDSETLIKDINCKRRSKSVPPGGAKMYHLVSI